MWPDYIGLDPEPVRSLAETTYTWQDSVNEALAELTAAETLIAEPIGVTDTLSQIGADGRSMGVAMQTAVDEAESFSVESHLRDGWMTGFFNPVPASDTWTPAMDGFVAAPAPAPVPMPQLSAETVIHIDNTVDDLAAEVARLNDMLEAGVDLPRRQEAWNELNEVGRTVTYDESDQFGRTTGSWVHRATADVAHEWNVDYGEAQLLHRRDIILSYEPTVPLHDELMAISVALNQLHMHADDVVEEVAQSELVEVLLPLPADEELAELDPFRDTGGWEMSVGTSRRQAWIERTRLDDEFHARAAAWADEFGLTHLDATLELAAYRALDDKGVNDALLAHTYGPIHGENSPRVIIETEARRIFSEVELRALENGWSAEALAAGHQAAIEHLSEADQGLGYPDSDENSQQLAVAYALLVAKSHTGSALPVLTTAELDIAVSSGATEDEFTALNNQVLSVSGAIANVSDANLAKGIGALATMTDATALLIAIAEGDDATIREKTADLAIGGLVVAAGRWLLPRVVGGPVVAGVTLVLAITEVGPPGDAGPMTAPSTGATNEFGVVVAPGPCMNAAGLPDTIACGG